MEVRPLGRPRLVRFTRSVKALSPSGADREGDSLSNVRQRRGIGGGVHAHVFVPRLPLVVEGPALAPQPRGIGAEGFTHLGRAAKGGAHIGQRVSAALPRVDLPGSVFSTGQGKDRRAYRQGDAELQKAFPFHSFLLIYGGARIV
jgi:hypothetical protein